MFRYRAKRQAIVNGTSRVLNLFVEYLVVIDSSVYNDFVALYGNITTSLMAQYLNIFFAQLINGVMWSLAIFFKILTNKFN